MCLQTNFINTLRLKDEILVWGETLGSGGGTYQITWTDAARIRTDKLLIVVIVIRLTNYLCGELLSCYCYWHSVNTHSLDCILNLILCHGSSFHSFECALVYSDFILILWRKKSSSNHRCRGIFTKKPIQTIYILVALKWANYMLQMQI